MRKESQQNSAVTAAAGVKVHHVRLEDIQQFTPEKVNHLFRGGIRQGAGRTPVEAQQLIDKIPPSQRAGVDGQSAAKNVKEYLSNKDASHIQPHSKGGSSHPGNIKWEDKSANRARGDRPMSQQEQAQLDIKAQFENLTGAVKAGIEAAPKGAAIGVITTVPFSLLKNSLRVIRGEISAETAALETVKEAEIGAGVGAVSAFTVTTVAVACPPIAMGLTAISPALLAAGGAGMIHQFFKILDDHQAQVRSYYESITQDQRQYLEQVETGLIEEHNKMMTFLAAARATTAEILDRPREPGVEGAFKRYMETLQIKSAVSNTNSM
ncbi:MAG: hypothetical protein ACKO24_08985 [Leptolyngbyaceae cyanobacterium]